MINITRIPGLHLFRKSNFVGYALKLKKKNCDKIPSLNNKTEKYSIIPTLLVYVCIYKYTKRQVQIQIDFFTCNHPHPKKVTWSSAGKFASFLLSRTWSQRDEFLGLGTDWLRIPHSLVQNIYFINSHLDYNLNEMRENIY